MKHGAMAPALLLAAIAAPAGAAGGAGADSGPSCQISLSDLSFGSYDPLSPRPADSAGAVTINCSGPGPVVATLSASSGTAITADTRRMTAGPDAALAYNLYRDAARQLVWGDGAQGQSPIAVQVHNPATPVRIDIYGRIPARQNVPPGAYRDEILVTLTF